MSWLTAPDLAIRKNYGPSYIGQDVAAHGGNSMFWVSAIEAMYCRHMNQEVKRSNDTFDIASSL
jgi:hypothetical protein